MRAKLVVALALVIARPALSQSEGRTRPVPPADSCPRDPIEYHEQQARLEGQPTRPERVPELWQAFMTRMQTLTDVPQLDPSAARRLVDELWADYGDPGINEANQSSIIWFAHDVGSLWDPQRAPPDVCKTLADGLRAFVEAGGGRTCPGEQAVLAAALLALDGETEQTRNLAEDLLADSVDWVYTIEAEPIVQEDVYRTAAACWGEEFYFLVYERLLHHPPSGDPPEQYGKARSLLSRLISGDTSREAEFYDLLRDGTEAALRGCGQSVYDDDLLGRLLVACQRLLLRKPPVAERAARWIDRQLQVIVREKRLTTTLHWKLWTDATEALGPRRTTQGLTRLIQNLAENRGVPEPTRSRLRLLAQSLD